ncbi:MAG: glycosyltransferase [Phycisphaeraceae bacterium]|nr:glycosyltransferase [Phycisphaeraceae bacterium]
MTPDSATEPLRILHLVEPLAGDEPLLACREVIRTPGHRHSIWLVGSSRCERRARDAGLTTTDRLPRPAGLAELAAPAMRALLAQRTQQWNGQPDIIQCWSVSSLALARLAMGNRVPRVAAVFSLPAANLSFIASARLRYAISGSAGAPTLLVPSVDTRDAWMRAGASDVRIAALPTLTPHRRDPVDSTRRHLLACDDPAAGKVVLLIADPPEAGDARAFGFLSGLLHVAGFRVCCVVPTRTGRSRRAAVFTAAFDRRWGLVNWPGPIDTLLAAADLVLWTKPAAGGAAMATTASRMGIPVVAFDCDLSRAALAPAGAPPAHVSLTLDLSPTTAAAWAVHQLSGRPGTQPPHTPEARAAFTGLPDFTETLARIWRESSRQASPYPRPSAEQPLGLIPTPTT